MLNSKLNSLIEEYGLGSTVDELKHVLRTHVRDLKRLSNPPHALIGDVEKIANTLEKVNLKKYV